MSNFKSHFKFNKQERSGIFFLLLLIFCCQLFQYFIQNGTIYSDSGSLVIDKKTQIEIDRLKAEIINEKSHKNYPFNPNYIDDFKGYSIGMSVEEIDSFLRYRASGKFVNSPEEFQKISGISDAKLNEIAPYFKFPEWQGVKAVKATTKKRVEHQFDRRAKLLDINSATADDLKTIYGIGETLSNRIIKFRDALGGFLVDDQLYDVYGLEKEVVESALKKFRVIQKPTINTIDLNTAKANEFAAIIYINKDLAQKIIDYRTEVGGFSSLDELSEILDFPSDKIARIKLYLSL